MKANEVPEKIYLNPLLMEDGESIVRECTFENQRDCQVEYTRTDIFIEKACAWFREVKEQECRFDGIDSFITHFKEAMKL